MIISIKIVLVTPINEAELPNDIIFVWEIPVAYGNYNVHAYLEIDDTDNTFASLEEQLNSEDDSGFQYWDGDSWEPYPSAGVTSTYYGNQARITLTLLTGEKWWRVQGKAG